MTRLDHDIAMATTKCIVEMVAPVLRTEEQHELFGMVFTALEASFIKRDELLKRERQRLGKPSEN